MKLFITFWLSLVNTLLVCGQNKAYSVPEIAGEFVHVFNPNDSPERLTEATDWYTNDHTFVKDNNGQWHAYGIIHHLPIAPWNEYRFFHISGTSLKQLKWEDNGYALKAKQGVER